MAYELFSPPSPALDSNANPSAGATWNFYASGTTTPLTVYADSDLDTPLGTTVTADAAGRFPSIYFNSNLSYRGVLKSADGGSTIHDIDPINSLDGGEPDSISLYGYVADGSSHPLSSVSTFKGRNVAGYSLAQWQALVPQVTSLSNEIDAVAVQAWFNDRPNGGCLNLPAGVAVFDIGIQTGGDQAVQVNGAGRDLTEIKFTGTGTFWKHGFTGATAANHQFSARDFRVTPAAGTASACCFNVRFSGDQAAWCHIIENVMVISRDTTSYFVNATITRNIKRGLDWRNFSVYGRNFFILGSDAHVFPSNVASDPDCPPGQENTDAGDSYNFDNCMTVGYNYGWVFDWTGWTDTEHSHEQGHWKNSQSYSGKGMIKAINTNYAYAPADNWIIDTPGWQGIGPAFDFENCEQIRIRDGLLVADASSSNNITRCGQFINCTDAIINANEIFAEGSWTGGNMWAVGGASTANVRFLDNMTVHYASMSEWLFVNSNVPVRQVEERGSSFRGGGAYSTAKINDLSQSISETRVKDIIAASVPADLVAGSSSAFVTNDGDIVFEATYRKATADAFGNITVFWPTNLFRAVKGAPMVCNANADDTTIPFASNPGDTGGVTVRCVTNGTSPASGTVVSFRVRQVGR